MLFRVYRVSPSEGQSRNPKFSTRSNSTLLDHCNLPALFSTNETPIIPSDVLKKRNPIDGALLSKLSINFDNPMLTKNPPSGDEEEEEVKEELTPNISHKKKRKRVRKRKGAGTGVALAESPINGSQSSTPVTNNGGHNNKKKKINSPSLVNSNKVTK